jgi:hypothetical protein
MKLQEGNSGLQYVGQINKGAMIYHNSVKIFFIILKFSTYSTRKKHLAHETIFRMSVKNCIRGLDH